MRGRFAPSPTGPLHLGNLRTAAIAWLAARSTGRRFVVRMEDLDRHQSSVDHERSQLADLAAVGLEWDGEVVRQSDRFHHYEAAIDELRERGLVYECYCTRREIRAEIEAAPAAPHLPPGSYPGTCRDLSDDEREVRRATGRPPALRLRVPAHGAAAPSVDLVDVVAGPVAGGVDDVVLRRNDGVPAYNLAVVVDDALQGVDQVVRADDLLSSTPRQALLQDLLGHARPEYGHVPLVLGDDGERLAKRHGAVTLDELHADGVSVDRIVGWIAESIGLAAPGEQPALERLVERFDLAAIPRAPVVPPRWPSHGA